MNVIYIVDTMNRLNKQRKKDSKKIQDKIKKLNKIEKDSWITKLKKYFKK